MYQVKDVVCDYGVYENEKLICITNSRINALMIKDILEYDLKYKKSLSIENIKNLIKKYY